MLKDVAFHYKGGHRMDDFITPERPKTQLDKRDREKINVLREQEVQESVSWYSPWTRVYVVAFAIILAATVLLFASTTPRMLTDRLPNINTSTPAAATVPLPLPTQRAF